MGSGSPPDKERTWLLPHCASGSCYQPTPRLGSRTGWYGVIGGRRAPNMVSQLSHVGLKPSRHPQCGFPIYFLGNCCFGEIQHNLEQEGDPQPPLHCLCPALGTAGVGPGNCYHTALSHIPLGTGVPSSATLPLWVTSYPRQGCGGSGRLSSGGAGRRAHCLTP